MDKYEGAKILVTGGTGSLGRALLTRASKQGLKAEFIILSRDESKQEATKRLFPEYQYMLGDVAKYRDVQRAMQGVDYVFHFAAYKQVPAAQNNVAATIETNIIGSQNIVDAAIAAGVKQVVASSTDKAAYATNAYGASKQIMEAVFQNANRYGKTTFHLARYGNVVSSTGSVIPLFRKQAKAGGPITVTHKGMTRFWISVDYAVDLLLLALDRDPGTIVVPMAPALSVYDIAISIAPELEILETGIRPGEKIHEVLVSEAESFHTIKKSDYFLIYPPYSGVYNPDAPFAYTSDKAAKIELKDLLKMIEEYDRMYA